MAKKIINEEDEDNTEKSGEESEDLDLDLDAIIKELDRQIAEDEKKYPVNGKISTEVKLNNMSTNIVLENWVFQTTKCVAGFAVVSSNDYDDEQFDFIVEATYYGTTDEESYEIKWSDKAPPGREKIEEDILRSYKLSNY